MSLFDSTVDIFSSNVVMHQVFQCIGVSCVGILLITYFARMFYIHRLEKVEKHLSSPEKKVHLSAAEKKAHFYGLLPKCLTVFVQIIFLIFLMLFTLNVFAVFENDCDSMAKIAVTIWNIARFSLYYLFVLRLKLAFGNSMFDYRKRTFMILLCWISFCFCWQLWSASVEITGAKKDGFCQIYCPYIAIFIAIVADGSISLICLVLFIKPLIFIIKHSDGTEKEFQNTVIKYTLLVIIAISSSALWFGTQIFVATGGTLSAVDSVVNTLCVILMDADYNYFYIRLCQPCVQALGKCCPSYQNKTENENKTEDVI